MNVYIREISELTDSRELLEAKPHPFVPIFISLLCLFVISLILWAYFGEMDVVAKAKAVVRPNENVSTIQTSVSSKIKRVNYVQGKKVQVGDVLLELDASELDVQKQVVEQQFEQAKEELEQLRTFKKSVEQHRNLFKKNNNDYYEAYMKYVVDYEKLSGELRQIRLGLMKETQELHRSQNEAKEKEQVLFATQREQKITIQSLYEETERLRDVIQNLQRLEKSYLENKNYVASATSVYANQYIDFHQTVFKLQKALQQKKDEYNRFVFLGEQYIPKSKIEQSRIEYEMAKLDLENYINGKLQSVRLEIERNKQKLNELTIQLQKLKNANTIEPQLQGIQLLKNDLQQKTKSLYQEISLQQELEEISLAKFKTDKLVEINEAIKQQEKLVKDLEGKKKDIEVQLRNYRIIAPINGVVNIIKDVNEGDIIHPNDPILTVIPDRQSQYKMIIYVLNKDISKMKVGDKANYHFAALPYREYGEIEGRIVRISTDSTVNPEDGISYYIVEATVPNESLQSYKGKKAKIKVGMQAEAIVVTDSKKILHYLLEKINLKE
ncbi:bacteriocin/lantibiotic exporter, bacteriocin-binding protein [Anoxybacillus gonensis]|uniref:Bacteriocin/lantibiotic exporter, bacteriocin-binding protein n=2 Tax=Anoxybacillus TaxID=150247 RepID=B7GKY7_ANOFW|nr:MULTISPECIES: HlyD family efflux transporter periplasmic adaptor subunit [Anoxybacillus]THD17741.1 bacteriocin transporter [Anoxybacillus ayderensis]ACJ34965.1 Bacteriocin/lantibiotic exporter, bacteriocin-binding protein [Anoxybacillus flavithermus WK1]AKS39531.1 bacteriocin/lantibiotic exporter, bacteriocin-binding protein [Anoxybacillus gonensis]KGP60584.1 bacteriocin/lantibiotic exporter, bacteriocin-binding protein [Anoxybacillus gonensis]MCX8046965.1 HlyD family efflux transporter per